MRQHSRVALSVVCILVLNFSGEAAIAQDLPTVKGKKIVASVNNEPITLDELNREVASIGRGMTPGGKIHKREELDVLKRMINTRLLVQEAKNIGLDKLPEVTMMVDSYSKEALREELAQKIMGAVKADDKEVERIYRESIQEWKISAVLCEKEEDAKSMEAELGTGKDFGEVANTFIAEQRAKKGRRGCLRQSQRG